MKIVSGWRSTLCFWGYWIWNIRIHIWCSVEMWYWLQW